MVFGFSARDLRILFPFAGLTFIGLADSFIITPILPELAEDFCQTPTDTNWLVTVYWTGAALGSLLAGPLLDYYGRKRILLVGTCLAAAGNFAAAGTSAFPVLLAFRFFVGLGTSMASVSHLTYMGDYFPYNVRGKAMGFMTVGFFAGWTLGIPLGGLLAEAFGWRTTLGVFAVAMGGVFLGCLIGVPSLPPQRSPIRSTALIRDVINLHRRRQPALAMLIYACIGASTIGFFAYAGDWLYRSFDYDITHRSQIFFWCGLTSLVFSPAAGIWADRSSKRIPAIVGSVLICLLMWAAPLLPGEPLVIYPAFMLLAAGISLRHSPLLTLVTEIVPAKRRGTFLTIKNAWTQVGAAVGSFTAGALYEYGGYQPVAIFSCILTAITVALLIGVVLEPVASEEEL